MGYGYYIIQGKKCGYSVPDICNEEGCETEIDRGLAYACGGEPGEFDEHCDGYFCSEHLVFTVVDDRMKLLCRSCAAPFEMDGALPTPQEEK